MADEFKKEEVSKKKNRNIGEIGVKLMAALLAGMMILPVAATAISYIFAK